jgi:F-type H+-transporting ATPase subunit delta
MKKTSKMQIARSYAQALYQAASDGGLLERISQEIPTLREAFADKEQLRRLNDPLWSTQRKNALLEQVAASLELSPVSTNFLKSLAENDRLEDIQTVLEEFTHLFYKKNHIKEICVESVCPLSAAQSQRLGQGLARIFGQKIALSYVINPELLGGLMIRADSVQIDDSLADKLRRLGEVMKGKQ